MSDSFSGGVVAGDIILQSFHGAVSGATKLYRDSETHFLREELHVRERMNVLDKIVNNINEERRLLDVQLQDCRGQVSTSKKKSAVLASEANRANSLMARSQLVQLEQEERKLDDQHSAINRKIQDIIALASELEAMLQKLQDNERKQEKEEAEQFNKEQDYEKAKAEILNLEREIENRRRSLERKEESISLWNRNLDARDADLAKRQLQFREELEAVEREEKALGINVGAASIGGGSTSGGSGLALQNKPAAISQRQVMDDHGMTIDRDDDDDEEVDSDAD